MVNKLGNLPKQIKKHLLLIKDIRKYIENDKYDEIIRKAIKNHNKFEIEKRLTEKELIFAKIIRDADKIDIIYESVEILKIDIAKN